MNFAVFSSVFDFDVSTQSPLEFTILSDRIDSQIIVIPTNVIREFKNI